MSKLKKWERKSPTVFSVAALVLYTILFISVSIFSTVFIKIDNYYLSFAVNEALEAVVSVAFLIVSGRGKSVFKSRKGFFGSLFVGMYEIVLLIWSFLGMYSVNAAEKLESLGNIIIFTVCMLLVGVTEEVFFRGVITDIFLENYGKDRKGIILSVAASGLIFGLFHITNLGAGIGLFGVLIQIAQAAILGIFFGAVYMRTHNIFAVIFLHAAMDFVSLSASGLWGIGTVESSIDGFGVMNLLPLIVYLIPTIFIMRFSKLDEYLAQRNSLQK